MIPLCYQQLAVDYLGGIIKDVPKLRRFFNLEESINTGSVLFFYYQVRTGPGNDFQNYDAVPVAHGSAMSSMKLNRRHLPKKLPVSWKLFRSYM